jgi:hypothetical protein
VLSTTAHAAAGASGARHSLRPLNGEGETSRPSLAQTSGEIANLHLAVIACDKREAFAQGSEATKQSILAVFVAAWIASLRSQ